MAQPAVAAGEALRRARTRLAGAPAAAAGGTPALDAEVLLRHVLRLSRSALYAHPERPLSAPEAARFADLVARRAGGEPVAYLTGEREFMGLAFAVDRRVLVPRPETEGLVERALQLIAGAGQRGAEPWRVVDVGTGSGAIAVSVAALAPGRGTAPGRAVAVFATDCSWPALEVARLNARRLLGPELTGSPGAGTRRTGVGFVRGSLLEPLRGPFDLVLANLPYIADREVAALPDSVRRFEPRLALEGGRDGLDLYRDLLRDLGSKLRPGATALLEADPGQMAELERLLALALPGATVTRRRDLAGRDRHLEARLPD